MAVLVSLLLALNSLQLCIADPSYPLAWVAPEYRPICEAVRMTQESPLPGDGFAIIPQ